MSLCVSLMPHSSVCSTVVLVHMRERGKKKKKTVERTTKSTTTHKVHATFLLFVSFAVGKKQGRREKGGKKTWHVNYLFNTGRPRSITRCTKQRASYLWRPPEGVTGTVSVVSLGSCCVRFLGRVLGPSPPPLSWSESKSSTLTEGRRLRLELSAEGNRAVVANRDDAYV